MGKPRSKREAGPLPSALSPSGLSLAGEAFTGVVGLTSRLASARSGEVLNGFYGNAPSMPLQFSRAGEEAAKLQGSNGNRLKGNREAAS